MRNIGIYVSPRNMNKEYITSEDMVYCEIGEAPNNFGAINLKNHGFLLYSDTLENLKELIKELKFSYRRDE